MKRNNYNSDQIFIMTSNDYMTVMNEIKFSTTSVGKAQQMIDKTNLKTVEREFLWRCFHREGNVCCLTANLETVYVLFLNSSKDLMNIWWCQSNNPVTLKWTEFKISSNVHESNSPLKSFIYENQIQLHIYRKCAYCENLNKTKENWMLIIWG